MPGSGRQVGSICVRSSPRERDPPSLGVEPVDDVQHRVLPAPFGPMMARISCSRTSKETSVSALTPPKRSEMF